MKTNNDMLHGGKLREDCAASWAQYYTRFIKAYEREGVPVWGISVQNEPMATQRWESCIYTAEEERDFPKNHLGPPCSRKGLGDKKIIVWDQQPRPDLPTGADLFQRPRSGEICLSIGFHWYESWAVGDQMYDNLKKVHERLSRTRTSCLPRAAPKI